jgi:nitrite reductase/ring-hydroxylating ferredoxin subunit
MKLCDAHQLADGQTLSLDVGQRFHGYSLLLIRNGLVIQAYVNSCPHTGAPLDYPEGNFLTVEKDFIQCKIHGALFARETGACVSGPCPGESLKQVPIEVVDGEVSLT